jgi:hypothetical protein
MENKREENFLRPIAITFINKISKNLNEQQ